MSAEANGHDLREESIAELVKRLAEQTNTLVKQEIELAKAELTEKGRIAGAGAGMFGAAALVGPARGRRADGVPDRAAGDGDRPHVARGADRRASSTRRSRSPLALRGRDRIREATPPAPEKTIESVKEDVEWAKTRTRSATR